MILYSYLNVAQRVNLKGAHHKKKDFCNSVWWQMLTRLNVILQHIQILNRYVVHLWQLYLNSHTKKTGTGKKLVKFVLLMIFRSALGPSALRLGLCLPCTLCGGVAVYILFLWKSQTQKTRRNICICLLTSENNSLYIGLNMKK